MATVPIRSAVASAIEPALTLSAPGLVPLAPVEALATLVAPAPVAAFALLVVLAPLMAPEPTPAPAPGRGRRKNPRTAGEMSLAQARPSGPMTSWVCPSDGTSDATKRALPAGRTKTVRSVTHQTLPAASTATDSAIGACPLPSSKPEPGSIATQPAPWRLSSERPVATQSVPSRSAAKARVEVTKWPVAGSTWTMRPWRTSARPPSSSPTHRPLSAVAKSDSTWRLGNCSPAIVSKRSKRRPSKRNRPLPVPSQR